MYAECIEHLHAEIKLFQPEIVLALGHRTQTALKRVGIIDYVPFRHPSNGCPQLHIKAHDNAFGTFANKINAKKQPNDPKFVEVRKEIQKSLFKTANPRK